MFVSEILVVLSLALVGPGTLAEHLSPGQLLALNAHFEEIRVEAERRAIDRGRYEEAMRQAAERERAERKSACPTGIGTSRERFQDGVVSIRRSNGYGYDDLGQIGTDALDLILLYDLDDRPGCEWIGVSERVGLFAELSFSDARREGEAILDSFDLQLSQPMRRPDWSSSTDICQRNQLACFIGRYTKNRADEIVRLSSGTIYIPDPTPRFAMLHELSHYLADYTRPNSKHNAWWLHVYIAIMNRAGALDSSAVGTICDYLGDAGGSLEICR